MTCFTSRFNVLLLRPKGNSGTVRNRIIVIIILAIFLSPLSVTANENNASRLEATIAMYEGKEGMEGIKNLIARGVNSIDDDGYTPLMYASQYGYTELVKDLIFMGAQVNAESYDGNTALTIATLKEHKWVIEALIDGGATAIASSSLRDAMATYKGRNDIEKIRELLLKDINEVDDDGYTSLMYASQYGYTELVKVLIAEGVKLNIKDNDGNTALMRAVKSGYIDVVKALIEAKAKINLKNNDGNTALILAAGYGHMGIVKALRSAWANSNAKNKYGDTAFKCIGKYANITPEQREELEKMLRPIESRN